MTLAIVAEHIAEPCYGEVDDHIYRQIALLPLRGWEGSARAAVHHLLKSKRGWQKYCIVSKGKRSGGLR